MQEKNKLMFKIFLTFFINSILMLSSNLVNAQSTNQIKITGNLEWNLVSSRSDIKIYTKEFSCIDAVNGFSMKKVFIKIENLTSDSLTVDLDKKLYYDNECLNCETTKEEYHVNLILGPNQKIESDCSENENLNMFIEMIGRASEKLTSFEFVNVKISK